MISEHSSRKLQLNKINIINYYQLHIAILVNVNILLFRKYLLKIIWRCKVTLKNSFALRHCEILLYLDS